MHMPANTRPDAKDIKQESRSWWNWRKPKIPLDVTDKVPLQAKETAIDIPEGASVTREFILVSIF